MVIGGRREACFYRGREERNQEGGASPKRDGSVKTMASNGTYIPFMRSVYGICKPGRNLLEINQAAGSYRIAPTNKLQMKKYPSSATLTFIVEYDHPNQ